MTATLKIGSYSRDSISAAAAAAPTGLTLFLVTLQCLLPVNATALDFGDSPHELTLGLRARVAEVTSAVDGRSASIKLRARLDSDWHDAIHTLVEADYVAQAWQDEFSDGERLNGKPVIPDSAGPDLNQARLAIGIRQGTQLHLGRERVTFGNQRFVGSNSFWQNEQTLDTLGLYTEFGTASRLRYHYVVNANRINGDDAGHYLNGGLRPPQFLGNHEHRTHLIFAQFKEWDFAQVQVYGLNMDIRDAPVLSNRTLGVRYEYEGRWQSLRTLLHAEVASQQRPDVDMNERLPYYQLSTGLGYATADLSINIEYLGEEQGVAVVTPLASLHDFNGWADRFLATPAAGLQDVSLQLIWRVTPFKLDARYHQFESIAGRRRFGTELDIDLAAKLSRRTTVLLRWADFNATAAALDDERRVFLQLTHDL